MAKVVIRHTPSELTYSERLAKFLMRKFESKANEGWRPFWKQSKPHLLLIWNYGIAVATIQEDDTNTILVRDTRIIPELEEMLKKFKNDDPIIIEIV